MATRRQGNFLGQMRVDVPDLRAIESGVAADFDILSGKVMAGREALVVRGFTIGTTGVAGSSADALQLAVASGLLLHYGASYSGTLMMVADDVAAETLASTNDKVDGAFTASSTNYIGLDFVRAADDTTADLKQFLDAGTNEEVPQTVPTARTLDYRIVISTTPFSVNTNVCPVAKVVTDASNNVTSVTDARSMFFRLGSGGDSPDSQNSYLWSDSTRSENTGTYLPPTSSVDPFAGGDKEILSLKEWMDAVMSRLWEVGSGQYWYSPTSRDNVKLVYGPVSILTDNFSWNSGTSTLSWEALSLAFENSTTYYNTITDSSAVMNADGQCLYVDITRSAVTALTPVVSTLAALGSANQPGSRFILAWRLGSNIYTRDRAYEIGRISPVATTTTDGVVRLNNTPGSSTHPLVPAIKANGQLDVASTASNSYAIKGTGFGSGVGLSGIGGSTIPTNFATIANGAGGYGIGGANGSFGFVGYGGSGSTVGVYSGTNLFNGGGAFIGSGSGHGVVGISSATNNRYGGFFLGSDGVDSHGVAGFGKQTGNGAFFFGGLTAATTFATILNGAGAYGLGGASGANGFVGYGGSGSNVGTTTTAILNFGVAGIGSGTQGGGVAGISGAFANSAGVYGEGSDGFNTIGISGVGKLAGYGGYFTNAAAASGAGAAIRIDAGHAYFSGSNPTSTTGYTNTQTPSNLPKVWGKVFTTGGSAAGVSDGFNLASVSLPTANSLRITIANDMPDGNYAPMITLGSGSANYTVQIVNQVAGSFDIILYDSSDSLVNLNATALVFFVTVFGKQ